MPSRPFQILAALSGGLTQSRIVCLLVAIGVLHRVGVLIQFGGRLHDLVAATPNFVTMQLLPVGAYRDHFWTALRLLQQTPPAMHFVMRLAVGLAPWPFGVAQALCGLGGALTIATSCVLFALLCRLTGGRSVPFSLSLWFMLSTDVTVAEYSLLGQGFYEGMAMLLVACGCILLLRLDEPRHATWRAVALLGTTMALCALTRSSLCYLSIIIALFGLIRWRKRGTLVAAYLVPVVLLQGGWALKNAAVYGGFSLETSSWGGLNAERGVMWTSQLHRLCDDIAHSPPATYPDWFMQMNRDCPAPFSDYSESYVPAKMRSRDLAEIGEFGIGAAWNTRAIAAKAGQLHRAIVGFSLDHPALAFDRFKAGYHLFWQRIGDFGAMLFDPLTIVNRDRSLWDLRSRGFAEQQRVRVPIHQQRRDIYLKANFWTLSLAPLDAISIIALHIVLPALLLLDVALLAYGHARLLPRGTAVVVLVVSYGVVLFSAVDVGENMRFRLCIEPEIICLTAIAFSAFGQGAIRGLRRMRSAGWVAAPASPARG